MQSAPEQTTITLPVPGQGWRHYKGGLYRIVGIGHDSRDGNALVIYETVSHHSPAGLWARPLNDFLGYAEKDVRRFELDRA